MHRSHLILNVTLVVCAVILVVVAANRYLIPRTDPSDRNTPSGLKPGSRLDVQGLDWSKNGRTLVFALSRDCRFCSESAGFYRKLLQELKGQSGIHTLAILPGSLAEGQRYLKSIDVPVDDIRQTSLIALGLRGTPTLMLINDSGEITELWFGRLTAEQEYEVISKVRANFAGNNLTVNAAAAVSEISAEELKQILKSGRQVTIVDVRDREHYARSHVEGSKNIPIDEIEVRAPNELSRSDFILTSCQCADTSLSTLARDKLLKGGFKNVAVLR